MVKQNCNDVEAVKANGNCQDGMVIKTPNSQINQVYTFLTANKSFYLLFEISVIKRKMSTPHQNSVVQETSLYVDHYGFDLYSSSRGSMDVCLF